jgi:hypothetical protein
LLRSAAGEGVKTRLQDAQRQSWTISIFFLRVPFLAIWVLPQYGQRSGDYRCAGRGFGRQGDGFLDAQRVTDTGLRVAI